MLTVSIITVTGHAVMVKTFLVQAAANELMAAEAEKAKWQSSINEVTSTFKHCLSSQQQHKHH